MTNSKGRRKTVSNKLKRAELQDKRTARRKAEDAALLESLRRQGRMVGNVVIPQGAIVADLEKQAPNNSYSPPLFYIDRPFKCVDCGKEQVWTASQQKWYYEVAKGPIYAQAVRCRPCRQKQRREAKGQESKDP
jgi:Probable zinc-ribbon domain